MRVHQWHRRRGSTLTVYVVSGLLNDSAPHPVCARRLNPTTQDNTGYTGTGHDVPLRDSRDGKYNKKTDQTADYTKDALESLEGFYGTDNPSYYHQHQEHIFFYHQHKDPYQQGAGGDGYKPISGDDGTYGKVRLGVIPKIYSYNA